MRTWISLTVLGGMTLVALLAHAGVPDPDPARFADEIATIVEWDAKNSIPEQAILFVGSSSIRNWATAAAFPNKRIINRGFGGSQMSDLNFYFEQLVQPYDASLIVLYEGDNDIEAGKSPAQVLEDFREFADLVQRNSDVPVLVLAIKPSVARWALWPTMVEANRLIRTYTENHPGLTFVDVAGPLLGQDGEPRDVYVDDKLHLNDAGYRIWNRTVAPYLEQSGTPVSGLDSVALGQFRAGSGHTALGNCRWD